MKSKFRSFVLCVVAVVCFVYFNSKLSGNSTILLSFNMISGRVRMAKYPVTKSPDSDLEGQEEENAAEWMKLQEEIQHQRLTLLTNKCKSIRHKTVDEFLQMNSSSFVVDPIHKLTHCRVPKIASTSWTHMFLILGGYIDADKEMDQHKLNIYGTNILPMLEQWNLTQRKYILESCIKFLYVRHPFSRVLSVFKNKLDPNSKFEHAVHWQKNTGMMIIKRYRTMKEFKWVNKNFKKNYNLQFGEFVKYIGDPKVLPRNAHWNDIYSSCHPCSVPYDFIGKMETMSADNKYLMKISKLDTQFQFPSSALSSPTNSSGKNTMGSFYKGLPVQDLRNLYNRFKLDFQLFDYPEPDYVNGNIIPVDTN